MDINSFNLEIWQIVLLGLAVIWELAWKGFALWRTAHREQPVWFTMLLVLNTVGILPIIYLLANKTDKNQGK